MKNQIKACGFKVGGNEFASEKSRSQNQKGQEGAVGCQDKGTMGEDDSRLCG